MEYQFKLKGTNASRTAYAVDVFLKTDGADPSTAHNFTDVVFYKDRGFEDERILEIVDGVNLKLMNSDCSEHVKKFESYL